MKIDQIAPTMVEYFRVHMDILIYILLIRWLA